MKKYGIIELPDDFEKKEDKCPLSTYVEIFANDHYYKCTYSKLGYCLGENCSMQVVNIEISK